VTEQHRFEHCLGERCTIDGDKRPVAAGGHPVDVIGEHFLAGTGWPVDEDADVALRDPFGHGEQLHGSRIGRRRQRPAGQYRNQCRREGHIACAKAEHAEAASFGRRRQR